MYIALIGTLLLVAILAYAWHRQHRVSCGECGKSMRQLPGMTFSIFCGWITYVCPACAHRQEQDWW